MLSKLDHGGLYSGNQRGFTPLLVSSLRPFELVLRPRTRHHSAPKSFVSIARSCRKRQSHLWNIVAVNRRVLVSGSWHHCTGSACRPHSREKSAAHRVRFAASSLAPRDPAATAPPASLFWLRYDRASVLVRRSLHTALRSDWFITCNRSLCFPWVQHLHSCVRKVADVA